MRSAVVNRSRSILRHWKRGEERGDRPAGNEIGGITNGEIVFYRDDEVSLEERVQMKILLGRVLTGIARLPDKQKMAMSLLMIDLDEAEIASLMGISKGAVKSHLSRARVSLREYLKLEKGKVLESAS